MNTIERRSLKMPASEWAALEQLAEKFQTVPALGPNTSDPSWRTLMRAIAQGDFILTPVKTSSKPVTLKPATNGKAG